MIYRDWALIVLIVKWLVAIIMQVITIAVFTWQFAFCFGYHVSYLEYFLKDELQHLPSTVHKLSHDLIISIKESRNSKEQFVEKAANIVQQYVADCMAIKADQINDMLPLDRIIIICDGLAMEIGITALLKFNTKAGLKYLMQKIPEMSLTSGIQDWSTGGFNME